MARSLSEEEFRPFKRRVQPEEVDANTFFTPVGQKQAPHPLDRLTKKVQEDNEAKGLCRCGEDHSHPYTQEWDVGGYSECPLNDCEWDRVVDRLVVDERATKHPLYDTWKMMWRRCYFCSDDKYKDYGARGILIHKDWADFDKFLEDSGPKPGPGYEHDRRDNNQGYSKDNCRWVTKTENKENTRISRIWHVLGVRHPSVEKAAYAESVSKSRMILMCHGYTDLDGGVHPPRLDCYSQLKYATPEGDWDDSRDWPQGVHDSRYTGVM